MLLVGGLPPGAYTTGDFDSIPTILRLTIAPGDGVDAENEESPRVGPQLAQPSSLNRRLAQPTLAQSEHAQSEPAPAPAPALAPSKIEDLPTDIDLRADVARSGPPPAPHDSASSDVPSMAAAGERETPAAASDREALAAATEHQHPGANAEREDLPASGRETSAAEAERETLASAAEPESPAPDAETAPSPARLVTTSGNSERSEPAADIPVTTRSAAVTISIPEDEQQEIAHKVLRWARGVRTPDPNSQSRLQWQQDGREYTAVLTPRPAGSSSEYDGATVEISTSDGGKQLRTTLSLRRLAFSHFTQFVDEWDSDVQLHDDEVIGRFHSNTRLTIGSLRTTPRFHGKVTTAASDYSVGRWTRFKRRSEIFQGGFQASAGRIQLPSQFIRFGSNSAMSDARIHSFDRHTRISFYSDGTYGWQPLGSDAVETRRLLGNGPLLLVGARNVELHVRGIVKGTVLVYSPERIWVDDDLTYATNPKLVPDAQDYTGLVSDRFVDIAGPELTGPGDLNIDAAIYARRSFTVQNEYARNPTRATLNIYGSLTAGTLSATEPRYATRLEFDPRFEHRRPPGFPMTTRYEVEHWDGQWIAP